MSQHMDALAIANTIRCEGLRIRRELSALPVAESRQVAADLLRNPTEAIAAMRIGYFLTAIRLCGERRAAQLMNRASLYRAGNRPISGAWKPGKLRPLTDRERLHLADVVEAS